MIEIIESLLQITQLLTCSLVAFEGKCKAVNIPPIPGFVSVLERQPARRAPVKRGTVFAGNGGSVPEAANWNKLSEACESSCLSH